jgi:hypothetical protein
MAFHLRVFFFLTLREYLTFMRPLERILETHGIFPVSQSGGMKSGP